MATLLSAIDKLRLQRCQLVDKLLTHSLAQSVRLATCETGKQSGEKHHLLLIHSDAISILQILLHHRDIIFDGKLSMLTLDKVGDIVHWTRTIQGVHRDKILKCAWLKLDKILLHTSRLKLERTRGSSLTIELVGLGVVDVDMVNIKLEAVGLLDILDSIFYD